MTLPPDRLTRWASNGKQVSAPPSGGETVRTVGTGRNRLGVAPDDQVRTAVEQTAVDVAAGERRRQRLALVLARHCRVTAVEGVLTRRERTVPRTVAHRGNVAGLDVNQRLALGEV